MRPPFWKDRDGNLYEVEHYSTLQPDNVTLTNLRSLEGYLDESVRSTEIHTVFIEVTDSEEIDRCLELQKKRA